MGPRFNSGDRKLSTSLALKEGRKELNDVTWRLCSQSVDVSGCLHACLCCERYGVGRNFDVTRC